MTLPKLDINPQSESTSITELLARWQQHGDLTSRDRVFEQLYEFLLGRARYRLSLAWGEQTRSADDIVSDVTERFVRSNPPHFNSRAEFKAYLTKAIAHLVIEHARRRRALRAGGDMKRVESHSRDIAEVVDAERGVLILNVDPAHLRLYEALEQLREEGLRDEKNKDLADIVYLKYWQAMTDKEAALELGLTAAKVQAAWKRAETRLKKLLGDQTTERSSGNRD